jgi:hypothetical protein
MSSRDPREVDLGAAASLLHEVAEGLQAACAYLEAARRIDANGNADGDVLQKASSELARVRRAYFRLRESLLARAGADRRRAKTTGVSSGLVEER